MLTKNSEILLQHFVENKFVIPDILSDRIPHGSIPVGVLFEQSPLTSELDTEMATNELVKNGYITLTLNCYTITSSGHFYFEEKKLASKQEWKTGFWMPLLSGFTSGVLVTLLTTWLLGLLKFQS
ncbi:hypothetical protein GHU05_06970 [Fructobacillus tropaeoli]|uniref:hypothetical protein n=1 Tax=Fructobacillus tropaeoli TaxID=709323 RepID=UPI0014560594|nr:hypothetical protein [Fructobacillus tropaeoli]NLS38662.1 hypothetical protein [Fructobacillus tropaeoli]